MDKFDTLALPPALLQALAALEFETMTPVQTQSLPGLLEGRDVIAQARTGSGKTIAFGLAVMARIDATKTGLQALVLCPTRELADQVSKSLRALARFVPNVKLLTLCGGIALRPQLASLTHEPHIVVGTPGRIQELLDQNALSLSGIRVLVLDEADRMLDMGFLDAISALVVKTPKTRQTLLFSATYPGEVRKISQRIQRDPVEITVDHGEALATIEQRFYEVDARNRVDALRRLLSVERPESALVFCNTRRDTADVADALIAHKFSALALHGDLDQRDRDEILVRFANRSCAVLVATDVAARGLDIDDLPMVVNYEVATDADAHIHRIGRTGRAGRSGLAVSLVAPAEMPRMKFIEERIGSVSWQPLPPSNGPRDEPLLAAMATLVIDAGRQDKLRPGDVLGSLTGTAGLSADVVGKIDIFATRAYVAIRRDTAAVALQRLRQNKIKGRSFRVRALD
ncbi:MAG: ATP-dependent RNA helicase DbpA [Dokdonella sp.]